MQSNIKFLYLYRHACNYKNFGEVVFGNYENLPTDEIRTAIQKSLIEGQWFVAKDLQLPSLFFKEFAYDDELDHNWHEFDDVKETDEDVNREEDLQVFLQRLVSKKYDSIYY
jgi:hypothetical protein